MPVRAASAGDGDDLQQAGVVRVVVAMPADGVHAVGDLVRIGQLVRIQRIDHFIDGNEGVCDRQHSACEAFYPGDDHRVGDCAGIGMVVDDARRFAEGKMSRTLQVAFNGPDGPLHPLINRIRRKIHRMQLDA